MDIRARALLELRRRKVRNRQVLADYRTWLKARSPEYIWDWDHQQLIFAELEMIRRGLSRYLIITMPPRHTKTESVTVRFPAFCIENDPTFRSIQAGYNSEFASLFSRKTKRITKVNVAISAERDTGADWETTAGGGNRAVGVGGGVTGRGANGIIVDDPVKNREEANSEAYRNKVWDWFRDDLWTRQEPGCFIIVIMTRWHHDDLVGRILGSEFGHLFRVLNLPALAEDNDPLGRAPGEALCPERYDREALLQYRTVLGRSFEALYQGRPTAQEGDLFKPDVMPVIDAVPAGTRFIRAWDFGATAGGGDWTAGLLFGETPDKRYVIADLARLQGAPDEVERVVKATASRDGSNVKVRIPQDPGQAGKSQVAYITRKLVGYSVISRPVTGDKVTRAEPVAAQVNVGNVSMLRAPWNARLMDEMRTFPLGEHDDIIDALSDAFNETIGVNLGLLDYYERLMDKRQEVACQA